MNHEDMTVTTSSDDMSVLRVLLHSIRGISPVAGNTLDFVSAEDDAEF